MVGIQGAVVVELEQLEVMPHQPPPQVTGGSALLIRLHH